MRERSQLSKSRLYRGIPRIHMLYYLLYILQDPGKNEFRIKNGPYVAVDLDRAGFIFHRKPVDAGFGYAWVFHSKASVSGWGMMANLLATRGVSQRLFDVPIRPHDGRYHLHVGRQQRLGPIDSA